MFKIKEITLTRLEGLADSDCFTPVTVTTFDEAKDVLRNWCRTAPEFGYDKVRVEITFEDGFVYIDRYDLKRDDDGDLRRHIWEVCLINSGQLKPEYLTYEQHEDYLKNIRCEDWRRFLDRYEL